MPSAARNKQIDARRLELKQKLLSAKRLERDYRRDNLIEFFNRPKEEGGMPANPLQAELLEAWDNSRYEVFTYSGANRLGKCLTYQTLIETPVGEIPIGLLFENKKPFDVYAWDGSKRVVAKAFAPFKKKGLHKCYRITMSNGQWVEAADYHRILTTHGWISVEQLHASFLRASSLEPYQPIHLKVISENHIESIKLISNSQEVYDFEVKKYHNYFAGGLIHHNTTILTIISFCVMFGRWLWNDQRISFPHNHPRKIRLIGQDWEKHIKAVLVPELWKWWPKNRKLKTKKNNAGVEYFWEDVKTGSTLEIMSNLQEPKLHEGWYGDLIGYDEPPKRDVRIANSRGLIDRTGRELFTMTLLSEAWIDREIIKKVDENGKPDRSVFNVNGDISINIGYGITQKGVDSYISKLDNNEISARIHGIPAHMAGLVYQAFSRNHRPKGHLVERFKVPVNWIIDIAFDIHPREKQAVLLVATNEKNDRYVIDEIWEHGDGDAIADEVIRRIFRNAYRVGDAIIDPLSKSTGEAQFDEDSTFRKIQKKLWQHDIPLKVASKDKNSGILAVKDHLLGPNNEPSLFVFDDCIRFIYEIEGYMWDEKTGKPKDKDDHMLENLYRILLLDTRYVEPDDEEDEDEEDRPKKAVNPVTGY